MRKHYIDMSIKGSERGINTFLPSSNSESLDRDAIEYIESLCDYIVRGIH